MVEWQVADDKAKDSFLSHMMTVLDRTKGLRASDFTNELNRDQIMKDLSELHMSPSSAMRESPQMKMKRQSTSPKQKLIQMSPLYTE